MSSSARVQKVSSVISATSKSNGCCSCLYRSSKRMSFPLLSISACLCSFASATAPTTSSSILSSEPASAGGFDALLLPRALSAQPDAQARDLDCAGVDVYAVQVVFDDQARNVAQKLLFIGV